MESPAARNGLPEARVWRYGLSTLLTCSEPPPLARIWLRRSRKLEENSVRCRRYTWTTNAAPHAGTTQVVDRVSTDLSTPRGA